MQYHLAHPPNRTMQKLKGYWEDMCGLIIRPQRCDYDITNLGHQLFRIGVGIYERTDLTISNPRGMSLQCSHFEPTQAQRPSAKMPCVVYLHGNCGSRQDATECVTVLLPHGVTLFTFDFSGSGLSDGEYVSLGYFEKQDLVSVIDYLNEKGNVSRIGLWGRSMGAVTSIMYSSKDHSISSIVCDSPFASLQDLMQDLVVSYKPWIPRWMLKIAINTMRASITKKAHFDINDLDTTKYAAQCPVPMLLGHAKDDQLVPISHAKVISERYQGECSLMEFDGGHNSDRPEVFLSTVATFFTHHLINKPAPTRRESVSASPSRSEAPVNGTPVHADPSAGLENHQDPELLEEPTPVSDTHQYTKADRQQSQSDVPNPEDTKLDDEVIAQEERLAAEAAQQAEKERLEAQKAEEERIAAEQKAEEERLAAQKAEEERIAAEKKAEEERLAAQKAEEERIAAEKKAEEERLAAEKAEEERIAAEKKAEEERLAAEAAQKAEEERLAAERLAAEKAEEERIAAEKKAEEERLAAEAAQKAEEERLAAEKKAEEERLAAEKAEEERIAAEQKVEEERLAAEAAQKAEEERIAAEQKAEEERIAAEQKAEEERVAAEAAEEERLAAEKKAEEERLAAEAAQKAEDERIAAEAAEKAEEECAAEEQAKPSEEDETTDQNEPPADQQ
eukprot:TRINITY_DN527_c0_g1_i11.p1 TRINITY_DN527_c0_g1~~TRINITY_DN527_c0_g1_i11.p1  ORF type:complete len:677 (+),score=208.72 TRINITY_DN527_c0_g1_i11:78-2108(+)